MGVVTIPVFVWLGFDLKSAIAILLPSVFVQTAFNCWQNRDGLPWRDVLLPGVFRLIFLQIGISALFLISGHEDLARQLLGIGLVIIILSQFGTRGFARILASERSVIPTACLSGFMAGLIGMGGPPLVVWVMNQNWNVRHQRTFLWLSFLLVVPVQALSMTFSFGEPMIKLLLAGLFVIPAVVTGAWLGNKIGNRLSPERLRLLMSGFLFIIAVRLVVSPLFTSS